MPGSSDAEGQSDSDDESDPDLDDDALENQQNSAASENKKRNSTNTLVADTVAKSSIQAIKDGVGTSIAKARTYWIGKDMNKYNRRGQTPLHTAVTAGNTKMVMLLLGSGADPSIPENDLQKRQPLHMAVEGGDVKVVNLLLRQNCINADAADIEHITPLMSACGHGYIEVVKLLLSEGAANLDAINLEHRTAFMWACEKGNSDIVALLLGRHQNLDVGAVNKHGRTALMLACIGNHKDVVALLLERDTFYIDAKDHQQKTAFFLACENGYTEVAKMHLEREYLHTYVDVNVTDFVGQTVLIVAARRGDVGLLRLLVRHERLDAKILSVQDHSGGTAHLTAYYQRRIDVLEVLLKRNDLTNPNPMRCLFTAAKIIS